MRLARRTTRDFGLAGRDDTDACVRLAGKDDTEREPPLVSLFVGLDLGTPMARYDGVCIRSDCPKKLTLCMIRSE